MTRTGWSVLATSLLSLGTGWALGFTALQFVGLGLLIAVGGAGLGLARPVRVTASRELHPARVTVDDVAIARVRVRNISRMRVPTMFAIEEIGESRVLLPVPALKANKERTITYRLPTTNRGVFTVGPLRIQHRDPFGIMSRERSSSTPDTFYVHPRRHALDSLPSTLERSLEGPTRDTAPRGSVAFHSLREYVVGDDLRHIHWRTTARTGTLMVRQHVDTSRPEVTVLLDLRRGVHSADMLEEAIEAAASIAQVSISSGFPLTLITSAGASSTSRHSGAGLDDVLDLLAGVETDDDHDLGDAGPYLRGDSTRDVLIAVVGTLDAGACAQLALFAKRFHRGLVISMDANGRRPPAIPGMPVHGFASAREFALAWNRRRVR